MQELPKAYNPKETEDKWYPFWTEKNYFHGTVNSSKKPYTIVIPPPNVTGILTMGHVLNNTIQDIFIRWRRMQGYEALWMPGTDHAGIATQNVVEKSLAKEGKRRQDLGREKFLERVWEWKEQYGGTIIKQLKKLGTSCDWERERFTMDEGLSDAVQEIFIRLYNKGLIYRGKYIINWCPKDHTAISDDEVNYTEQQGNLYFLKYPIKDSEEFAIVATTRPETMLGDTGIAVNPNDERHKHLIGKKAILPLVGRELPIVADDYVDPTFGTGMVKMTPAHDPNDYWVGKRHDLEFINVFTESASINENAPAKYQGMDRFECRKAVMKDLEEQELIVKVETHVHNVGRCYRCDTVIEPYYSDQWFVKMKPLAEKALKVVQDGTIHFHPDRWTKTYEHWMNNIRDWCISRQLWWGHRIPVWYCEGTDHCTVNCKEPVVSRTKPPDCPHCGASHRQDNDVLDTWFSSALWPYSTLGWPSDNPELRYFYPTDTLVTGPDIIFFWVARMIMTGLEVMEDIPLPDGSPRTQAKDLVPFHDVYFTSIIRDAQGRKMSKSLGNSPDPLDVIAEYGADALRFTVIYLAPLGQDVLYSNEKCEMGRNFTNKIWNAGRFLLMNKQQLIEAGAGSSSLFEDKHLDLVDRWILSRLHTTIGEVNELLERFEINQATKVLYEFMWHDFCDWYVERIKERLYGNDAIDVKQSVLNCAVDVFENSLRLLHPFMPFITEELWHYIGERQEHESIMVVPFPVKNEHWINKAVEEKFEKISHPITVIRNIKGEINILPSIKPKVYFIPANVTIKNDIDEFKNWITRASGSCEIQFTNVAPSSPTVSGLSYDSNIYVSLEGSIEVERDRLTKEIARVQVQIENTEKKLSNESFVSRAPKDIIDKEKEKLENFKSSLDKLRKNLGRL